MVRPVSQARSAKEADHLAHAALRLVLEEEVARVLERRELGARDLACETRRVVGRKVVVLLAPEDRYRHLQSRHGRTLSPPIRTGGAPPLALSPPLLGLAPAEHPP